MDFFAPITLSSFFIGYGLVAAASILFLFVAEFALPRRATGCDETLSPSRKRMTMTASVALMLLGDLIFPFLGRVVPIMVATWYLLLSTQLFHSAWPRFVVGADKYAEMRLRYVAETGAWKFYGLRLLWCLPLFFLGIVLAVNSHGLPDGSVIYGIGQGISIYAFYGLLADTLERVNARRAAKKAATPQP